MRLNTSLFHWCNCKKYDYILGNKEDSNETGKTIKDHTISISFCLPRTRAEGNSAQCAFEQQLEIS